MSASNNMTAGTEPTPGDLQAAWGRLRVPIERCRCLEEFVLAAQHVRLEGLVIREGIKRKIVARGVRVLIRTQPVGDLPTQRESRHEVLDDISPSWFDAVPEGECLQQSTDILIDQADIAELIRGLQGLKRISEKWPDYTHREHEAVYAWDRRLVFRTVKRNLRSVDLISCATDPPITVVLPIGRIRELIEWLDRLSTALGEAEDG